MVCSRVNRNPARVREQSMTGEQFCRALTASSLEDMGALRLKRPVSPDSLPPSSRKPCPALFVKEAAASRAWAPALWKELCIL